MAGRRKTEKLERKRRLRISRGLKKAIAEGRRLRNYLTEDSIQKMKETKVNNPKVPWNKDKTGVYSEVSLQRMRIGQYYRFRLMFPQERNKMLENMKRACTIRYDAMTPTKRTEMLQQLNRASTIRWQKYKQQQREQ